MARGLCSTHWKAWRRGVQPDVLNQRHRGHQARGSANGRWNGGIASHPLRYTYVDMVGRCTRPTHHHWKDYGGRGITVCERWRASFWAFVEDMGERPEERWLDRINNDGNYEPGNCRWATYSESAINRRTAGWEGRQRDEAGRFV